MTTPRAKTIAAPGGPLKPPVELFLSGADFRLNNNPVFG